jgi:hypothetical protein
MTSRRIALLLGCAVFSPVAQAQHIFRNTSPGVRYAGSTVCGTCHPKIFASYAKTAMGRSMRTGDDASLDERLPAPATVLDKDTGQYIEVFRKQGALYQSDYAADRDGKEIFRQTFKAAYVVGSGENGLGFLVQRDNYLFEAPLSYYTKSRMWSFSPGYEVYNHAFARPVV